MIAACGYRFLLKLSFLLSFPFLALIWRLAVSRKEFPVSRFPHLVVCPKMNKAAPGVQTVRRVVPGR